MIRVLIRKLRLLMAHIVAVMDMNQNLNILLKSVVPWLPQLWLDMASNREILSFSYTNLLLPGTTMEANSILVASSGIGSFGFQGHFPFSWFLKNEIEKLFESYKNNFGSGKHADIFNFNDSFDHNEVKVFNLLLLSLIKSTFKTPNFMIFNYHY